LDGYAMNLSWPENRSRKVVWYEFAGDRVVRSRQGEEAGSYLFMEASPERTRRVMSKRNERAVQPLDQRRVAGNEAKFQPSRFLRLISSRAGREWVCANENVKTYLLCQVEINEMEIWLGAGPARREDVPLKIIQKI
jgi:hypothetical protein